MNFAASVAGSKKLGSGLTFKSIKSRGSIKSLKDKNLDKSHISAMTGMSIMKDVLSKSNKNGIRLSSNEDKIEEEGKQMDEGSQ